MQIPNFEIISSVYGKSPVYVNYYIVIIVYDFEWL